MVYELETQTLYAVVESLDAVVAIKDNGATQVFDIFDIPTGAYPHDIIIMNDYFFVSYGADDGTQNNPIGIGVFKRSDYSHVTTLIDANQEVRHVQGLVAIEENNTFYAVDGYYGAPNDITKPRINDPAEQNVVIKFEYNK